MQLSPSTTNCLKSILLALRWPKKQCCIDVVNKIMTMYIVSFVPRPCPASIACSFHLHVGRAWERVIQHVNVLFIACDCLCFVRSDSPSCACIYWCADNHHCSAVCGHLCYVQTEEEHYSSVGFYACLFHSSITCRKSNYEALMEHKNNICICTRPATMLSSSHCFYEHLISYCWLHYSAIEIWNQMIRCAKLLQC